MGDPFAGRVRVRSCAIILNEKRILLIKQNSPTRPESIWLPPGGGVEMGETSREAVIREVFEETHLKILPQKLLYIHEFVQPPYQAMEFYYLSEIISGEVTIGSDPELKPDNQQIKGCEFIGLTELKSMPLYPTFLQDEIQKLNLESISSVKHFISS